MVLEDLWEDSLKLDSPDEAAAVPHPGGQIQGATPPLYLPSSFLREMEGVQGAGPRQVQARARDSTAGGQPPPPASSHQAPWTSALGRRCPHYSTHPLWASGLHTSHMHCSGTFQPSQRTSQIKGNQIKILPEGKVNTPTQYSRVCPHRKPESDFDIVYLPICFVLTPPSALMGCLYLYLILCNISAALCIE